MVVKIKIKYLRYYIIFFAVSIMLALSAESVWLSNNPTVFYISAASVLGLAWLNLVYRRLTGKQIAVIAVYWALGIIYLLLKGRGSATGWALFAVLFPLCFSLLFKLSDEEEKMLLKAFVCTVSIIALASIILWFFASVIGILSPTDNLRINWGGGAERYRPILTYIM